VLCTHIPHFHKLIYTPDDSIRYIYVKCKPYIAVLRYHQIFHMYTLGK